MKKLFTCISIILLLFSTHAYSIEGRSTTGIDINSEEKVIPQTQNWYAWLDLMPSTTPPGLYVVGDVLTANPGVSVHLAIRDPNYLNSYVLNLDLHLVQQPGNWIQVLTWQQGSI